MTAPSFVESSSPRLTRAVQWLLGINVAVYFLQLTVLQPSDVQLALGFRRGDLEAGRWWSVATYMFAHGGFWHLALNMYSLWLFGPRVERGWGARRFAGFYLFCGLGGWLLHLFVAGDSLLIGASAAILGVMLAYATLWPDDEVLLFGVVPMTIKWLMIGIALMNVIGGIGSGAGGGVAYLAHLGGLGAGWLYLRTTMGISLGQFRDGVSALPDDPPEDSVTRAIPRSPRGRARREQIDDVVARTNAAAARRTQPSRRAIEGPRAPVTMDQILDKISAQGIDSLSAEERRVLDEHSRRLRDQ